MFKRIFIFVILVSSVAAYLVFGGRTTATLPDHEVRGMDSMSFPLYSMGGEGVTTAIGQVFAPPEKHRLLLNVSFFCREAPSLFGIRPDISVKLFIASWDGQKPTLPILWQSDPILVKGTIDGWIEFPIPHLQLSKDQKYIAWLSASGVQNPEGAAFGIVGMGPRTSTPRSGSESWKPSAWNADYPDGYRAFWRGENLTGKTAIPDGTRWITDPPGHNLHFKMQFENKRG